MLDSSSMFSNYLQNLNMTDNKPKGLTSKKFNAEEQKSNNNPASKFGDSDVPDEQDDFLPLGSPLAKTISYSRGKTVYPLRH